MTFFQLIDNDGDPIGVIAAKRGKLSLKEPPIDMQNLFTQFVKETDSPDGDPDGFVDFLATKGIVSERIFLTEICT